ncbi:uroporphyrinogen-III synthase [Alicyclobacillus shizuokensis]|uniref:uroporphyrinogen-III synthase n=1 Tax=Alicyclobacillus shizuokensis TaxID=392014 RepID=UPI00082C8EF5|nr:uroporphyrinogen-III synthase [Alicyclobacillus shizuokensis]
MAEHLQPPASPDPHPLTGVFVLVTRPRNQAQPVMELLQRLGARACSQPLIDIEPVAIADVQMIGAAVDTFDAVVFTSQNAVAAVQTAVASGGVEPARWPTVYAVGSATARAAGQLAARVEVPSGARGAREVFSQLARRLSPGSRVWFPHGNLTPADVYDPLVRAGHTVVDTVCYRTTTIQVPPEEWRVFTNLNACLAVFLYSPSAARAFLEQARPLLLGQRLLLLAVGETTARACAECGRPVDAVAPHPSDTGMVEALVQLRAKSSG